MLVKTVPIINQANEMELVLTHYVRARGLEYDSMFGWAETLAPFMSVAMTRGDR